MGAIDGGLLKIIEILVTKDTRLKYYPFLYFKILVYVSKKLKKELMEINNYEALSLVFILFNLCPSKQMLIFWDSYLLLEMIKMKQVNLIKILINKMITIEA